MECESKEMDERHTNSTFSQSTGAEDSLLSKPTPSNKNREGTGKARQKLQAAVNSRHRGALTGTQRALLSCHNKWIINWISQTQAPWTNSSNNYRTNDHRLRSLLNDFLKELTSQCCMT